MGLPTVPVLLTSSVVVHDAGVALKDTQLRTELALDSVREWLRVAPGARLVLCDGSGHDFTPEVQAQFPGAAIECLAFQNDISGVQRQGRGFGEGEIVRHAVEHSRFIAQDRAFAKCTSKLWVENYTEFMAYWNGHLLFKAVFDDVFSPWRPTRLAYIDTRFYVVSVDDYRAYFLDAHARVNREAGYGLEECFRDVIATQHLSGVLCRCAPVIEGVGGGTGSAYRNPLKRRLKERLRVALAQRSGAYAGMFSG